LLLRRISLKEDNPPKPWRRRVFYGGATGLAVGLHKENFMASPESCIFYEDSKCLFKGDACDLKCHPAQNGNDGQSNEEIDKLIEWRIENKPSGGGDSGVKSG
jgi:hypothetical protein